MAPARQQARAKTVLGTVRDAMSAPAITAGKATRLDAALRLMEREDITKLPVLDGGSLVGVCTDGLIADKLGQSRSQGLVPSALHASKAMSRAVEPVSPDTPLEQLLPKVGAPGLTMLPVLDRGVLVGVHTKSDLLPFVSSAARVEGLMQREVHTVAGHDRLAHARRLLLQHDIARLPVVAEGRLVGIVAEWEIANAFARFLAAVPTNHQRHGVRELRVHEYMVDDVVTATPDLTARRAAEIMLENDVGGLPVTANGGRKLVGMVTRTDLIRTLPAGNR